MKNPNKVILFDLDGTIIDTEPYHYQCWNFILNYHGFDITYQHYLDNYAGVAIDNNCSVLIDRYQLKVPMAELARQKEEGTIKFLMNNDLQPMTYVRELISILQVKHIRLGLVTSSSSEETRIILKSLGLDHVFEYVVTRDDVINKKPHPEPYLSAKKYFGFSSERYLVFEDSISGVNSAKQAGMKCFAVSQAISPTSAYHYVADGVFKDLADLASALFRQELRAS